MTFFVWIQFALVCLLGAASPGPSLALIIHNSISYNRLSGIIASLAHGLGIFLYATITVIALELILANSKTIFFIIQILGSIFLFFLGVLFLKKNTNDSDMINKNYINSNSFVQGFIIAIINPKILVWFVAIYSQFIHTDAKFSDKIILVLTPAIVDAVWYSLVAILITSYGLKEILNKRKSTIQKLIGVMLIIISIGLIYSLLIQKL